MNSNSRLIQVADVIFDPNAVIHCYHAPACNDPSGNVEEAETTVFFMGSPSGDNFLTFRNDEALIVWNLIKDACITVKPAPWEISEGGNHAA